MTVLVLGATGATGRLVARELISRGNCVKVIVRSLDRVDTDLIASKQVEIVVADIVDLPEEQLIAHIKDCEAVICCLGHNLTLKGIYGQPRKLVTDTTKRVCQAIVRLKPLQPIKFVLMSTSGYQNLLRGESVSWIHNMVIQLIRTTLPPHVDNEEAARYLQYSVSDSSTYLEWAAVRPDSLVDQSMKSEFSVHPSPICDPLFASMKSSRINVANFMVELISSPYAWITWKNEMPVLYNKQQSIKV
ncbi:NAD-dependent epimerase/dehydratase [Vibrio galatheae]|uniref:NAD-dependent epimerase/dehydratase n=1 Tax=Vibrio galatheae TaxID=579748 RepID=A0A0F4NFR2_9VIBR|nr:NAD(P)-binding oxidoreductase [Vibrio galatheae]KJY81930.1 NAD-dependent epimerase/dehydratase [Vibrio galatheae]